MRDIWRHINSASLVITDMTGRNANVFYELGMAHAVGVPVVLIAQNVDDIPFDLRGVRTIIYGDSPSGYEGLADKVVKYVHGVL